MGFTIPNYEEAVGKANGVGDQAEPDSVDFQILGNQSCGVIHGYANNAEVTGSASDMNVTVAAYTVLSNGTYLTHGSSTTLTLDAGGANPRYDLVVITSGNTVTFRKGTESSTNPVFPALTSGDVVLAAVYRPAGGGASSYPVSDRITDKRYFITSNTTWLKTAAPTSNDGINGDIWIDTSATANGQSKVWIKSAGSWENLAEYIAVATTNTASTLVQRDASGNFSAGTITANLTGTASAAPWTGITGRPTVGNVTVGTSATPPAGSSGDVYIQV